MPTKPKPRNPEADTRRFITLVEVLASDRIEDEVRQLCFLWGVSVVEDRSEPPLRPMSLKLTIQALAKHVVNELVREAING